MAYFRVHIPFSSSHRETLDRLMELGLIPAFEDLLDRLAVIADEEEKEELMSVLAEHFPDLILEAETIADQDWNRSWKENFQPLSVGRSFYICAPWHDRDACPADRRTMVINPGQAFGTGTHETTQLVMELMEKYSPAGRRVLDLGCGSGILSIAASMLGAQEVNAFDYDPVFFENMEENVAASGVGNIRFDTGDVFSMTDYPGDYCLMNIEKHIIRPAMKRMASLNIVFRDLFLSGLLVQDKEEMTEFCRDHGYETVELLEKGEWIGIYLKPI